MPYDTIISDLYHTLFIFRPYLSTYKYLSPVASTVDVYNYSRLNEEKSNSFITCSKSKGK